MKLAGGAAVVVGIGLTVTFGARASESVVLSAIALTIKTAKINFSFIAFLLKTRISLFRLL